MGKRSGLRVFGLEDIDFGNPYVSDKTYANLGVGYAVGERTRARLNVANLTDEAPPLLVTWSGNTDPFYHDLFGRSYTLSLSMQF